MLRTEAGRDPYNKALTDLIGELSTRSDEFSFRSGAHDVQLHRTGVKQIRHPVAGELHLSYDVMELTAYPVKPWSPSARKQVRRPPTPSGSSAAGFATHQPADALETPRHT